MSAWGETGGTEGEGMGVAGGGKRPGRSSDRAKGIRSSLLVPFLPSPYPKPTPRCEKSQRQSGWNSWNSNGLIHPQNRAPRRVAEKLCTRKTASIDFNGEAHDLLIYQIQSNCTEIDAA